MELDADGAALIVEAIGLALCGAFLEPAFAELGACEGTTSVEAEVLVSMGTSRDSFGIVVGTALDAVGLAADAAIEARPFSAPFGTRTVMGSILLGVPGNSGVSGITCRVGSLTGVNNPFAVVATDELGSVRGVDFSTGTLGIEVLMVVLVPVRAWDRRKSTEWAAKHY